MYLREAIGTFTRTGNRDDVSSDNYNPHAVAHVFVGALVLSSATAIARAQDSTMRRSPPVAPVRPVTDDYFGTKVVDNYRYFEKLKDPEVQQWMKAQADYTRAILDALPGYGALFKRIDELSTSQPAWVGGVKIVGGRYYSLRTPANAQSPKLDVRDGVKGQDKPLIDPEKIPGNDTSHYSIDDYRPSPDSRYIAYLVAAGGSEEGVLHILDVTRLRSSAYLGIDRATGALGDDGLKPAGPYDHADDLAVDEIKVKSWDGTLVPMSIIHKKGITLDGNNLTMITGYGAYGVSMSPFYGPSDRSWYARGARCTSRRSAARRRWHSWASSSPRCSCSRYWLARHCSCDVAVSITRG